uniref:glycine rich domain-containing protein n=1 Tax=Ruminococcus flavefaciens TaxID=1265 RepID=UPI0026ED37C9
MQEKAVRAVFVYGTLNVTQEDVNAGKKLYYEVGSKGASQTRSVTGGGTDGLGGGAGDIAVFSVGAGGGYSAVYLLDGNETISDNSRDNPEKVLMIAGGGGGGGAGAALHSLNFLSTIFGGEGKANGGDGGYENSQLIATPSIGMFNSGKYYSGEDGSSSGTKGAYVGQGGTDRPGEVVSSFIGFLEGSSFPNDWQKTYHAELERGAGGAGNFRGGGGGAGFAGGSGGLQNEPLDARNVGGGGGGSSYIGSYGGFTPFAKPENTDYFIGRDGNDNADVGGAVVITYMSESSNYDYLNNVKISADISKYFDIVPDGTKCVNKIGNSNQTLTGDDFKIEDDKINITGSVEPISNGLRRGQPQNTLTLTLKLKPKEGFAGGNDVPIFDTTDGMAFTCTENKAEPDKTCTFLETNSDSYSVSHVNVPFNYKVEANSFTWDKVTAENNGTPYSAANIIKSADTSPNAFTDSIAPVYVAYEKQSTEVTAAQYEADAGTKGVYRYDVVLEVTPLTDGNNSVGTANTNPTRLRAKSIVEVIDGTPIDGFTVKAKKSLDYNDNNTADDTTDDTYDFTVDLDIESQENTNKTFYVYDPVAYNIKSNAKTSITHGTRNNSEDNDKYQDNAISVNLEPGYYFIEAWGADGGNSGRPTTASSGIGGKGAYKNGYIYISSPKTATVRVGIKGWSGINFSTYPDSENRAFGGGHSQIIIDDDTKLIAGGGGGATVHGFMNIGSVSHPDGYDADTPDHTADTNYGETSVTNYILWGDKTRTPGRGGKSEVKGLYTDPLPDYIDSTTNGTLQHESSGNGSVRITKLGVKGGYGYGSETSNIATSSQVSENEKNWKSAIEDSYKINGFTLEEDFSQYFKIDDAGGGNASGQKVTYNVNLTNAIKNGLVEDQFPPITGLSYSATRRTYHYSVEGNDSYTVKLKRKDNLVGGNDIPLLNVAKVDEANATEGYMDATTGTEVSISHSGTTPDTNDDTVYVKRNDGTDWANVKIKDIVNINPEPSQVIVNYNGTVTPEDVYGKISFSDGIYEFVENKTKVVADEHYIKDGMCSVVGAVTPSPAEKAVYIAPVEEYKEAVQIPVKVMYTVKKVLTNIKQEAVKYSYQDKNTVWVPNTEIGSVSDNGSGNDMFILDEIHDAYVLELTAADNWDLPSEKEVTVQYATSGADVEAADVVKKDGMIIITIPASAFTDNINITASGAEQEMHKVVYMYEVYDPLTRTISMKQDEDNTKYVRGAEIDPHYPFEPNGSFPTGCDGYTWDWPMNAENGKYKMGETDVYVVGRYKKITYKLKIEYVSDDLDFPAQQPYYSPDETRYYENTNTFDIALTKDAEFYRRSPDIPGYVPDKPFITLKVTDEFIADLNDMIVDGKTYKGTTERVTYTKVPDDANVIVNFVKCDVSGVPLNETSGIDPLTASGGPYNLDEQIEQKLTGWEPIRYTKLEGGAEETVNSVSGNLATGESATYYVYFREKLGIFTLKLSNTQLCFIIGHLKLLSLGISISLASPIRQRVILD